MAVAPGYHYDWEPTRLFCAQIGLQVDEPWFPLADEEAHKHGLTQEQFDAAMRLHAWHVRDLFNPKRYGWRRILVALHFLFGRMP